jgi:hypothetical protein
MKSVGPQERSGLLGESAAMQAVRGQLREVAATDLTVLLLGETGTGKGVAARLLHEGSRRTSNPFVAVDCGALPSGLVDSELFGHERGAFTGAVARRPGKCERADHGTREPGGNLPGKRSGQGPDRCAKRQQGPNQEIDRHRRISGLHTREAGYRESCGNRSCRGRSRWVPYS